MPGDRLPSRHIWTLCTSLVSDDESNQFTPLSYITVMFLIHQCLVVRLRLPCEFFVLVLFPFASDSIQSEARMTTFITTAAGVSPQMNRQNSGINHSPRLFSYFESTCSSRPNDSHISQIYHRMFLSPFSIPISSEQEQLEQPSLSIGGNGHQS